MPHKHVTCKCSLICLTASFCLSHADPLRAVLHATCRMDLLLREAACQTDIPESFDYFVVMGSSVEHLQHVVEEGFPPVQV